MATYLADFAWSKPSISALKSAGYSGVIRYLSYDNTGKNLSRAEAAAYRAAGLTVTSNWEYDPTAAQGGYSQGVKDAAAAIAQHLAVGGTKTDPIYFSVDWDASDAQKPTIGQYFRGVASVIGKGMVGAYGSHYVIKYLFDNGLITYGWGTYAWSGNFRDPRCHIQQIQNGVKIGGADCDRNQAMISDYGQWGTPAAPTSGGFLMALTDAEQLELLTIARKMGAADPSYKSTQIVNAATQAATQAGVKADAVGVKVDAVKAELDTVKDLSGPGQVVDPAQLAAALTQVPDFYTKLAAAISLHATVSVGSV